MEPPESGPEGGDSIETSLSLAVKQNTITVGVDAPNFEPLADVEQVVKMGTSSDEFSRDEACKTLEDRTSASSEDAAYALCSETERDLEANTGAKDGDRPGEVSLLSDVKTVEVEEYSVVNDGQGAVSPDENLVEQEPATRASDVIRNISDFEQDCDLADPLEFARQVAIEVEREVVDCREESSSSSDAAPESVNQLPDNAQLDLSKEAPSEGGHSEGTSELREDEPASSAENLANQQVNATQEIESSQVTNVNRELTADAERSVCKFDLNEKVCVEKIDGLENQISTPIAAGSPSSAATAPGMPVSPFQFEGNLGWKGSAATSPFQATSVLEVDKVHSVDLNIDLNIHDSLDEETAEPLTESNNREPSGFLSWESAVETSQRISERPELDLNFATDDGDGASDSQAKEQILHLSNGYHNRSSSSSSSKQSSVRNINLNDKPSLVSEVSGPYFIKLPQDYNAPVAATKSNDSVISIMGVKVEVNKRDTIPNSLPFFNGTNHVPTLDANLARTGGGLFGIGSAVPYAYGYTGLLPATGGAMSSGMYGSSGPFPYMFDSIGAPVLPQVMGATSTLQPVFTHPHLMMGVASMPGSYGVGPSEVNLDLNAGSMLDGNRDNGGLRQYLFAGHGRLMEDSLMSNSQQTSNLVAGMKRREPDSGWEPELLPFKHHQPTWK